MTERVTMAAGAFLLAQRAVLDAGWSIDGQTRQDNTITLTCSSWGPPAFVRTKEVRVVSLRIEATAEEIQARVAQELA